MTVSLVTRVGTVRSAVESGFHGDVGFNVHSLRDDTTRCVACVVVLLISVPNCISACLFKFSPLQSYHWYMVVWPGLVQKAFNREGSYLIASFNGVIAQSLVVI